MPDPLAFGPWMKQLRANLDLTQEALAEAVDCAPQTIRSFESGARRPSRQLTDRLADALQVPVDDRPEFLRRARPPGSPAPASRAMPNEGAPPVPPTPILATKLYQPRPRAERVARPRLLAHLDAGLAGPLTIIAAPPGFGKTTLLADWLASQGAAGVARLPGHHSQLGLQVAWLGLDASDSDPHQFLRYLVAALQTIEPAVGAAVLNLLRAAQPPAIEPLVRMLAGDLGLLPERSILVLDDYHVVEAPAVHQALSFLLDHLPPQLHLVIASRADPPLPLSRLRARGQLIELRAHDLRFTSEEAAEFLQGTMNLPLSADDIAVLEARTEGWIAGLQLAALSLRDRPREQRTQFIDAFTGSHRFVVDYLVDEALARQPPHLQTFLLQTSILERLSGPLCDAVVLGDAKGVAARGTREQASGQTVLEQLERANLFIVPLDDARRWYRYHHLFAQVLRERLASGVSQDAVAMLHRRASVWFEGQGLVVEAVQHALAAQDWERAARLIEEHGLLLIVSGHAHTVLSWLSTLPEPLVRARPSLLHLHALALFFVNQLEAAELRLQVVEEMLSAEPLDDRSRTILGYATMTLAAIARFRGELTRSITLSRQALEILPGTDGSGRNSASLYIAWSLLASGDVTPANERRLAAAVVTGRELGEPVTVFNGLIMLAGLHQGRGRLRQAVTTYGEAAQVAPEPEVLRGMPNGAAYYFGLGNLVREWNDLDAAGQQLQQGQELVRGMLLATVDASAAGYVALARLQEARGDSSAAHATLHEFDELARKRTFPAQLIARSAAARAHLELMQGDLDTAAQWANSSGLCPDDDLSYPREPEYLTLARVRITQGRRDPAGSYLRDALHLLDRLLESADAGGRMDSVIEILVLRALALQAQGELDAAFAALGRALSLASPEGYVRVFVDEGAPMAALLRAAKRAGIAPEYVATLLATFPTSAAPFASRDAATDPPLPIQTPQAHVQQLDEALSERELEVLRLLVAGYSNRAIADELVVAVGTVKRHVSNIMGKLQSQSRLEAVARARELGLL